MKEPRPAAGLTRFQAEVTDETRSALRKYQDLVVGRRGLWSLVRFELFNLFFADLGGALGLALRRWYLRRLFQECGRGLAAGRNLTLRHPNRIRLGRSVVIADNCVLDGKGTRKISIVLGDRVFIGQNSILSVHDGYIELGDHVNIGANCTIQSSGPVIIENDVIMAAYCHVVASSRRTDRTDVPILAQGVTGAGIRIGAGTWLGSGVIVVDGVTIGRHCVVGAGAVVVRDLPDYSIAVGVPARVIRSRRPEADGA